MEFMCEECGCQNLLVKEYYKEARSVTKTQNCHCGRSENGLAYKRTCVVYVPGIDFYHLNNDHSLEEAKEYQDDFDEVEIDNIEVNVYCSCYDPNGECEVEENDLLDIEVGDVEFFVVCAHCSREIEFGWSFPQGEIKIWPVECSDFDPGKCDPEPRYKDEWAKRSWLKHSISH